MLFWLAALVWIAAGCSDGDDGSTDTPSVPETPVITIDPSIVTNGLAFATASGEQSIGFSTNVDWTLSIAATTGGSTWCTASASSGSKGAATVKFSVTENDSYDDRSVSVTIKAGTASTTFTITQKCASALLVTTGKYEVGQDGGNIEIEVKANIDYQMEIAESAKSWITKTSTRALTSRKHILNIAANEDVEKREGEIYFKSGDKLEIVKVYQACTAVLLLSQDEYVVSDKGETISVDIKSNVEYGVQMPDVDWISDVSSTRGLSSHTLKYVVSANEGYDNRSARIIFYDKNSDLKDTLTIVQAQKDAIILAQKEYEVNAEGGTIEVKLTTNIDYSITIAEDAKEWISMPVSGTRSLVENNVRFNIATNEQDESRTGTIIFCDKNSTLKEVLTVMQAQKDVIILAQKEYEINAEGGSIEVKLTTNADCNIVIAEDAKEWISMPASGTRSLVEKTIRFNIAANKQDENRTGSITFSANGVSEKIEVLQYGNLYTIVMPNPGWLEDKDLSGYKKLKLIGDLNGTDILVIRLWQGEMLDLSEANIVEGGSYYYYFGQPLYTENGVIGPYSFAYNKYLKTIVLPNTITKIARYAFNQCVNLMSVENGPNITEIEECAFYQCAKLVDITIPNSVMTIGEHAFSGCNNLRNIVIPNSVTTLAASAFRSCRNLRSVTLSEKLTTIESSTFFWCTNLRKIVIPNSVKQIEEYAFCRCDSLASVILPDSITYIGNWAFRVENGKLRSIVLPSSIVGMGSYVFAGCGLTSVYSYMEKPCGSYFVFREQDEVSKGTLYVPKGTKMLYAATAGWGDAFEKIVEMEE